MKRRTPVSSASRRFLTTTVLTIMVFFGFAERSWAQPAVERLQIISPTIPLKVRSLKPSPRISVQAVDEHDNLVSGFNGSAFISSDSPTTIFATNPDGPYGIRELGFSQGQAFFYFKDALKEQDPGDREITVQVKGSAALGTLDVKILPIRLRTENLHWLEFWAGGELSKSGDSFNKVGLLLGLISERQLGKDWLRGLSRWDPTARTCTRGVCIRDSLRLLGDFKLTTAQEQTATQGQGGQQAIARSALEFSVGLYWEWARWTREEAAERPHHIAVGPVAKFGGVDVLETQQVKLRTFFGFRFMNIGRLLNGMYAEAGWARNESFEKEDGRLKILGFLPLIRPGDLQLVFFGWEFETDLGGGPDANKVFIGYAVSTTKIMQILGAGAP